MLCLFLNKYPHSPQTLARVILEQNSFSKCCKETSVCITRKKSRRGLHSSSKYYIPARRVYNVDALATKEKHSRKKRVEHEERAVVDM